MNTATNSFILISSQPYRLGLQLLFWLLLLSGFSTLLMTLTMFPDVLARQSLHMTGITFLLIINSYYLFPRFFVKKLYVHYFVNALLISFFCVLLISSLAFLFFGSLSPFSKHLHPFPFLDDYEVPLYLLLLPPFFLKTVFFFFAMMGSTLVENIHLQHHNEQIAREIAAEKTATELQFLKSQVNPHFLFNTLNNIYGLSLVRAAETPEVVLKLSELLRYMLYECNKPHVPLQQEIFYIDHFIALQKLKTSHELKVSFHYPTPLPKRLLAPLLLIPFVENAFKHSTIENPDQGWIKIALYLEGPILHFHITNSIIATKQHKDKSGGIGLPNVKRRLVLLYPKQHQLSLTKKSDRFEVRLWLKLDSSFS